MENTGKLDLRKKIGVKEKVEIIGKEKEVLLVKRKS